MKPTYFGTRPAHLSQVDPSGGLYSIGSEHWGRVTSIRPNEALIAFGTARGIVRGSIAQELEVGWNVKIKVGASYTTAAGRECSVSVINNPKSAIYREQKQGLFVIPKSITGGQYDGGVPVWMNPGKEIEPIGVIVDERSGKYEIFVPVGVMPLLERLNSDRPMEMEVIGKEELDLGRYAALEYTRYTLAFPERKDLRFATCDVNSRQARLRVGEKAFFAPNGSRRGPLLQIALFHPLEMKQVARPVLRGDRFQAKLQYADGGFGTSTFTADGLSFVVPTILLPQGLRTGDLLDITAAGEKDHHQADWSYPGSEQGYLDRLVETLKNGTFEAVAASLPTHSIFGTNRPFEQRLKVDFEGRTLKGMLVLGTPSHGVAENAAATVRLEDKSPLRPTNSLLFVLIGMVSYFQFTKAA